MDIVTRIAAMRDLASRWRAGGGRIGLVPTMGNLHVGHLRLVEDVQARCDRCVVSIYVNPLQFAANEDLATYPRTLDADLARLREREVDAVFVPDDAEMYPRGREAMTQVVPAALANMLEGKFRPGHFAGVATVVTKLFNVVQPSIAAFGEKDLQQLRVIERVVADLDLPVELCAVPTVRDADGLALSSRNAYLSPSERAQAPQLYQTLCRARERLQAGEPDLQRIEADALASLAAAGFRPEYISIRCARDLAPAASGCREKVVVAAAWLGGTRLIDNVTV